MIYLGSDHRGFELKEIFKSYLKDNNIPFVDLGPVSYVGDDDYPEYSEKVGRAITSPEDKGVLICGGGHGVCVAANKIKGIRASVVNSVESARSGRSDDNLNILCLAADFTPKDQALEILKTFLNTPFSNAERHVRRLGAVARLES